MSRDNHDKELVFELEEVAVGDLRPHPRNYRDHPDDQLGHIIESIREHGFYRNIVVARDGTILAGHGVVKAAAKMGYEQVPVIRLDLDPDSPRAYKVLVGDNEISHLGMRDDRALTEMLKEIKLEDDEGLFGTGFDEMMLANLVFVTRSADEIEDFNEAAHWVGMPEYDEGGESPLVTVRFDNEEDREKFIALTQINVIKRGNAWAGWWPPRKRDDLASLRFE